METVSRISAVTDPARELTVEAAQAIGISKRLGAGASSSSGGSRSLPFAKLKALLDSRSDREILDGLRRVISMIYQNKPCLPYFSSVVKNVANPNVEVKKLVYIYLLHYAESDPDLALLSVNAIQKSLSDQNPQVRAIALRTMSGMRVPVISQIVSLAIKRGVGDMSPQVRKAAALAIPKCFRLDPSSLPQLLDYLSILLSDKQYFVVGPAVQSFLEICPERIDLIHKHYRSLVKKLVDMDDWGQLATLRLLLYYSRKCFPQKIGKVDQTSKKKSFYEDEDDEANGSSEPDPNDDQQAGSTKIILDPDLELLLKACRHLLFSRNPAIIVAVASCYLYLGTPSYVAEAIGPLVALTRGTPETAEVALCNIALIALSTSSDENEMSYNYANLLVPYASHFLISSTDNITTWRLKIELLTLIFPRAQSHLKAIILSELEYFSHSGSTAPSSTSSPTHVSTGVTQVQESVRAIGRCAQTANDQYTSARCFKVLLNQIASSTAGGSSSSPDNTLVSEVLTVMRHLIQRDPQAHKKTIIRLARNLDRTASPMARATIIWLVGEYANLDDPMSSNITNDRSIAADVLRILVKDFASESEEAKLQIILLAAKVYLNYLQGLPTGAHQKTSDVEKDNSYERFGDDSNGDAGGFEAHPQEQEQTPPQQVIEIDSTHPIPQIWEYILLLSRYDTSYDIRDRARLLKSILSTPSSTQLASLLILAPKPVPHSPSPSESRKGLALGSTTLVLGRDIAGINGLPGYEDIPAWVEEGREPDPRLRDGDGTEKEEYVSVGKREASTAASKRLDEAVREQGLERVVAKGLGGVSSSKKPKGGGPESGKKSLDAWLDESEEEVEDEDEEASDSSEEEETSEEETESSEEEETDYENEEEEDEEEVPGHQAEKKGLVSQGL